MLSNTPDVPYTLINSLTKKIICMHACRVLYIIILSLLFQNLTIMPSAILNRVGKILLLYWSNLDRFSIHVLMTNFSKYGLSSFTALSSNEK